MVNVVPQLLLRYDSCAKRGDYAIYATGWGNNAQFLEESHGIELKFRLRPAPVRRFFSTEDTRSSGPEKNRTGHNKRKKGKKFVDEIRTGKLSIRAGKPLDSQS